MSSTLYKLLTQPLFISKEIVTDPDKLWNEDDFTAIKRKNRLFTNKQKELCWQRVVFNFNLLLSI